MSAGDKHSPTASQLNRAVTEHMLESVFMGGRLQAPASEQPVCQSGISQTVILAFNSLLSTSSS